MKFDDHKLPLSAERSNVYWESDLSERDLWLLDEPSRPLRASCGAARRAAGSSAPAADRLSRHPLPAPGESHDGSPGPAPTEDTR